MRGSDVPFDKGGVVGVLIITASTLAVLIVLGLNDPNLRTPRKAAVCDTDTSCLQYELAHGGTVEGFEAEMRRTVGGAH